MEGSREAQARATLDAMQERLASGPHVALGVDANASAEEVRAAFLKLTKRYHPAKFARMPSELQRLANEVFLALKAAHEVLAKNSQRASGMLAGRRGPSPPQGVPVSGSRAPTPPFGVSISTPGSTPPRGVAATVSSQTLPRSGNGPAPRGSAPALGARSAVTPATPFPALPRRTPSASPPPRSDAPDPGGSGRFSVKTPPPTIARPGVSAAKPHFDENRVLAAAHELLRGGQWTPARQAFHALATRVPSSRQYRALLSYARARETAAERPEDARIELERALQLDPELTIAKDALAELLRK